MRILVDTVASLARRIPPHLRVHLWRYGLVGVLSTVVFVAITALLVEVFGVDPVISSVGAFVVVLVMAYVLNHHWVFASERNHLVAFPRFIAVSAVSLLLNAGIMHLSVHVLGWWYGGGLVAVTAIVPAINFVMNYLWCFRGGPPSG